MVLADETANPRFVAADLLSQAEHDEMASAILVTTSETLAEQVSMEVDKFVATLSRKEIIQKSLDNYGYILVADTMQDAIDTVNEIASEHLELVTKNPFETMTKSATQGQFLSESIPANHSVIILQVQTMSFRPTEPQNSSHRSAWMISLRNQALSLIPEKR